VSSKTHQQQSHQNRSSKKAQLGCLLSFCFPNVVQESTLSQVVKSDVGVWLPHESRTSDVTAPPRQRFHLQVHGVSERSPSFGCPRTSMSLQLRLTPASSSAAELGAPLLAAVLRPGGECTFCSHVPAPYLHAPLPRVLADARRALCATRLLPRDLRARQRRPRSIGSHDGASLFSTSLRACPPHLRLLQHWCCCQRLPLQQRLQQHRQHSFIVVSADINPSPRLPTRIDARVKQSPAPLSATHRSCNAAGTLL
jgi:hypothetical protein